MDLLAARARSKRFLRGVVAATILCLGHAAPASVGSPVSQNPAVTEDDLRAQVILGILRFVQWEGGVRPEPLSLCILGKPDSAETLLAMDGRTLWEGVTLQVVRQSVTRVDQCDVAVTGPLKSKFFRLLTTRAEQHSVLTICDKCARRSLSYSMLNIVKQSDKIRFRVDITKVRKAGLRLDASLLELASEIER